MATRRFYIPAEDWNPENLRLTGDDAKADLALAMA